VKFNPLGCKWKRIKKLFIQNYSLGYSEKNSSQNSLSELGIMRFAFVCKANEDSVPAGEKNAR
jgi:hypothetical protein